MNLHLNILFRVMRTPHICLVLILFTSSPDDTEGKERVLLSSRKSSSVCEQLDIFNAVREMPPPVKQSPETFSVASTAPFHWIKCSEKTKLTGDTEPCFPFAMDSKKKPKLTVENQLNKKENNHNDNGVGVTVRKLVNNKPTVFARPPHVCERECSEDPMNRMTCHFNFTVEPFWSMGHTCKACPRVLEDCLREGCVPLNGLKKGVAVVNRRLPGPPIRVCQHDTVVVDVANKMAGAGVTIHWHGIHQKDTPWMDGVPQVTQCYVQTSTTFRYTFEVPTCGTYWWHSHAGALRGDGVFGALVIRQAPFLDPYGPLKEKIYDFDLPEHELLIGDFRIEMLHETTANHMFSVGTEDPEFLLVNGRGVPPDYFKTFKPTNKIPLPGEPIVPLFELRIKKDKSYRIRVINHGTFKCPTHLSVEKHSLNVIAADGVDIVPAQVDSIILYAGERWDLVLRGDQPVGSYWIKVQGLQDCDESKKSVYGLAVLNYDEIPAGTYPDHTITRWKDAAPPPGLVLNPLNEAPGVPGKSMTLDDLYIPTDVDPDVLKAKPDHEFMLVFVFHKINNLAFPGQIVPSTRLLRRGKDLYLPQINYISHTDPSSPPLSQPEILSQITTCDDSHFPNQVNCTNHFCECTHLLKVKLNSVVEMVLLDKSELSTTHPIHMHGYSFSVVGMERPKDRITVEQFRERDKMGLIRRKQERAILKDTVALPSGGYLIYRFRADNPGFWFLHCHLELHAIKGLALIVQVGEPLEMAPTPMNFPRCGNYKPSFTMAMLGSKPSPKENFDFSFPHDLKYQKLDFDYKI